MINMTSRRWAIIFFCSLAVNVILGSLMVSDKFERDQRRGFRGITYTVPWAVRVIGKEMRPVAFAAFEKRRDQFRTNRQKIREKLNQVNRILTAQSYNRIDMVAALTELRETARPIRILSHETTADFVAQLTPEQRKMLARMAEMKWQFRAQRAKKRRAKWELEKNRG